MIKKFIPFIIIGFIVAFVAGLSYYRKSQDRAYQNAFEKNNMKKQKQTVETKGSLKLVSERNVVDSKDNFTLTIYADSAGQAIGGYDSVINFDSKKVTFIEARNMSNDLQMFVNQRDNGISVTHIKSLESSQDIIHSNTPIAELVFTPKMEERVVFTIAFSPGNTDDSNIVTLSAQDILGSVTGTELSIGKGYILKLNTALTIPQESLKVTLKKMTIPSPVCADCVSELDVEITDEKNTHMLTFTSGGIAGKMFETGKAFNHLFDVEVGEDKAIRLFVSRAH